MSSISRAEPARPGQRQSKPASPTTARREVSALETHLGYWLRLVSNHVSHAFKIKVERHGVTVAEWVVLRALFERDGVKPSELAAGLGLTRGAISKLVERLATKELLEVCGDARDGRAQVVTLRSAGRRLVPKLAALADENDAEAFGHLDEGQRAQLFSTLKGIVGRLNLQAPPID
jgi:DNA-binding MarR family transcriptional regulator